MACLHPLKGYRSKTVNPSGKRGITFKPQQAYTDMPIDVPCGQCIECRIERSRQWAMRCVHESTLWPENCFITLTYDDEHLPFDIGLHIDHVQRFLKRLRKLLSPKTVRFFSCGEYGELNGRPHYHMLLFNHDFKDKQEWKKSPSGEMIYTSLSLENIWQKGFCTIGNLTFESAAYVARYITKKLSVSDKSPAEKKEEYYNKYQTVNYETGEIFDRKTEYIHMSRRPGIGKGWFDQYYNDVYTRDYVVLNGRKLRPPKSYDRQYDLLNPRTFSAIKAKRVAKALKNADNYSMERLEARAVIVNQRMSLYQRNLGE